MLARGDRETATIISLLLIKITFDQCITIVPLCHCIVKEHHTVIIGRAMYLEIHYSALHTMYLYIKV